jgi:hypothetical protein
MTGTDKTTAKKKKLKSTNNDLQITTQTTKDSATRAPLKLGENSGVPEGLAVPVSLVTPVMLLLNDTNIMFETTIRI